MSHNEQIANMLKKINDLSDSMTSERIQLKFSYPKVVFFGKCFCLLNKKRKEMCVCIKIIPKVFFFILYKTLICRIHLCIMYLCTCIFYFYNFFVPWLLCIWAEIFCLYVNLLIRSQTRCLQMVMSSAWVLWRTDKGRELIGSLWTPYQIPGRAWQFSIQRRD